MKKVILITVGLFVVLGIIKNISTQQKVSQSQKQTNQNSIASQNRKQNEFDVSYGTDPRNTMHIVIPKDANEKTPFVLFLHGGEWRFGDKRDLLPVQKGLAEKSIASASMNYRYASSTIHFEDMMQDVGSAVTYIKSHGHEWNMNTGRFVIAGVSAGAHMSLLYTYKYDTENTISAVLSLAGPTDMTDTKWLDHAIVIKKLESIQAMVGGTYTPGKPLSANFSKTSPIQYIKNVPTLMVHGTADSIVFYSQSAALNAALEQKGIPHKLVTIQGADHDMGLGNPISAKRILNESLAWITKYAR